MNLWQVIRSHPDLKIEIASSRPIKSKIGSNLIMWYQKTDYSHVLVIINDMVFQASHGYTNAVPLELFTKDNTIVNRIEIEKEKCDLGYLFNSLGHKYGTRQLFNVAIKYVVVTKIKIIKRFKYKDNGNKNLICSEYVGRFLMLDWVNDLTDPEDIISYLITIKK